MAKSALPFAVYLVYDILELERGGKAPFKVYRINPKFMEIMREQKVDFKT